MSSKVFMLPIHPAQFYPFTPPCSSNLCDLSHSRRSLSPSRRHLFLAEEMSVRKVWWWERENAVGNVTGRRWGEEVGGVQCISKGGVEGAGGGETKKEGRVEEG